MDKKLLITPAVLGNKEQLVELSKQLFAEMDLNHDSALDMDEFKVFIQKVCQELQIQYDDAAFVQIFQDSDMNKDGKIQPEEAEKLFINLSQYLSSKK